MSIKEKIVETDVLVIGGGIAGCFAAIKAKEKGVDVTLVDKGYVGKSGQTPYARGFMVFNPEWGHKLDICMNRINVAGEYVNNQEWTEIVFKDSYARYQDLVSWGVDFSQSSGSSSLKGSTQTIIRLNPNFPQVLRKQVAGSGVNIIDRIMVIDLLKQDGRVVGAIGIPMDSYDFYVFKAKATVMSVGASSFRPAGYPAICQLTGDGEAMAYKAGAEIIGKEFVDVHFTSAENIGAEHRLSRFMGHTAPLGRRLINAEGNELPSRPPGASTYGFAYLELEFETHDGRAPIIRYSDTGDKTPMVGGACLGMSVRKTEGIWPINTKCATSLLGLFAAGDTCGNMQQGAVYNCPGGALAGSSSTGTRAGLGAAEYALKVEKTTVDDEELARAKEIVYMPVKRKGGFSPRWVTQVLQNLLMPYFILYIKHGKRLSATLTLVEFLRDHLVPKLTANDPHELRLAHETKNMVLNAEMRLRSSLFRTESRGTHYREDYPRRDDPNWLAWVKLKEKDGTMMLWKEPIPEKWWPDLSKQYAERYPFRFPE